MKLAELQKLADKGYSGGSAQGDYFDKKTGQPTTWHPGDTLEHFMHIEIAETFDPKASKDAQISEAIRVLEAGINDLQGAIDYLAKQYTNKK